MLTLKGERMTGNEINYFKEQKEDGGKVSPKIQGGGPSERKG